MRAGADRAGPARPVTLSLEDLYNEQYLPLVRLAHALSGSNAIAEDLVQDAFIGLKAA